MALFRYCIRKDIWAESIESLDKCSPVCFRKGKYWILGDFPEKKRLLKSLLPQSLSLLCYGQRREVKRIQVSLHIRDIHLSYLYSYVGSYRRGIQGKIHEDQRRKEWWTCQIFARLLQRIHYESGSGRRN